MKYIIYTKEMIDTKLNEFCSKGNLEDYRITLKKIIETILESSCLVSVSDISDRSSIRDSHIRIGLKNKRSNNLSIIWDILHEYGHHLSGPPDNNKPNKKREKLAWDYAEMELKKHQKLTEKITNFQEYKKHCLKTYKTCA